MIGFLKRLFNSNTTDTMQQEEAPTLLLGRTIKKNKNVYLPIKEDKYGYSRANQLVIAKNPQEVSDRIFSKYIRQDFKHQEAYHANTEVVTNKSEWNNLSFQSHFLSSVSIICMKSSQAQNLSRQAISESIPTRDIHIFDPADSTSPRLDLMSLPNNSVIALLDNILNQWQQDDIEYSLEERKNWITWMVMLEKAYAKLEHREPTFSDLLEFFRNPSTIMDIHHYVEDNLNEFSEPWVKELTDTLDTNFHLGDSKQNNINFDIYEGLLKYRDKNILGKFLFDEDRPSASLPEIWSKGGICIFSLAGDLLSKEDSATWGSIIRSNFTAGLQEKAQTQNKGTLQSVYLFNASDYLDDDWYKLLISTSTDTPTISFNIVVSADYLKEALDGNTSLSNFLQSKRLVESIYRSADTIDFEFYDHHKYLFSIERDQNKTLKQAIASSPLPSGILITKFNDHSREIYRY